MSYAAEVRAELSAQNETAAHCREAALLALLFCLCKITLADEDLAIIRIQTEQEALVTKCFTLLEKTLNIEIVSNRNEIFLSKEHPRGGRCLAEERYVAGQRRAHYGGGRHPYSR